MKGKRKGLTSDVSIGEGWKMFTDCSHTIRQLDKLFDAPKMKWEEN